MIFKYPIRFECNNCGHITIIKIPKGETIKEFLGAGNGRCRYCSCSEFKGFAKLKHGEETWCLIKMEEEDGEETHKS